VFYFNGNLKHAADDLYNKALKAFFSVKSKFNNFAAGGTNKEYHIIQSWDVTVVKPDAMLKQ
jgi:hypothetical protein